MKFMQKLKKNGALLLCAALCCALAGGCVKDKRFSCAELARRLRQTAPEFAFAQTDLFFADGVWRCWYSVAGAQDTLLTLKEDGSGRLEQIALAAAVMPGDEAFGAFRAFALALAETFIPGADTERLREQTGLDAPERLREKALLTYRQGFYDAAAFSTPAGTVFVLTYGAGEDATAAETP